MGTPGLSPQTSSLMHNVQNLCTNHKDVQITSFMLTSLTTETWTRGSHGFKYFIEHTSRTVREWKSLPSDIVSTKSLDIIKSMLSGYLQGD
ncbi:unnamed protein product [Porites evermanni]|uniref:Uncharacterized protein n=1 Tax=Porites evermanni TaxID=104178 RepID=A0ABN8LJK1_9CNID|nr:unnamed protein product [Porites evermanni]